MRHTERTLPLWAKAKKQIDEMQKKLSDYESDLLKSLMLPTSKYIQPSIRELMEIQRQFLDDLFRRILIRQLIYLKGIGEVPRITITK